MKRIFLVLAFALAAQAYALSFKIVENSECPELEGGSVFVASCEDAGELMQALQLTEGFVKTGRFSLGNGMSLKSFNYIENNLLGKKGFEEMRLAQENPGKKWAFSYSEIMAFFKAYKFRLPRDSKAKYLVLGVSTGDYEYTDASGQLHLRRGGRDYILGRSKDKPNETYYIDENGSLQVWNGSGSGSGYVFVYDMKSKSVYVDYILF